MTFMIIQFGSRLKFYENEFTTPIEVGVTQTSLYRDGSRTHSDKWTVIKVFGPEEQRKLRGLYLLLGSKEANELCQSLFSIDVLAVAEA